MVPDVSSLREVDGCGGRRVFQRAAGCVGYANKEFST